MGGLFGSKVPDTSGQNAAAQTQANIAQDMWNQYKTTYQPMEDQYVQQAQNYNTPEHQEQAAEAANADVVQSFDAQKDQAARQMSSYGITPDSGKFQSINNRLNLGQAAQQAAAQTGARRQVEQTGWDRQTQALSLGKGLPATAAGAASGAATAFGGVTNAELAGQQAGANNLAGAVGGGVGLYNSFNSGAPASSGFTTYGNSSFNADGSGVGFGTGPGFGEGGLVDTKNRRLGIHRPPPTVVVHHRPIVVIDKDGARHYAYGGPVGAMNMARQAGGGGAPAGGGGSVAGNLIQGANMARGIYNMGSNIASKISAMNTPTSAIAPDVTFNSGLGAGAADEGISGTSEMLGGAGAAGAADAAVDTGAAAAAAGAGTADAVATAAELAPLILLASKGGVIRNEVPGGGIRGPGTETSDSIPARLSDGEFVLNAEAVKHFGVDKLEKMNEVGLKKRYGIGRS